MYKVVLDTNVVVSALWSKESKPFQILEMFFKGEIELYYSSRIIEEYAEVLSRDKLGFSDQKVLDLLYEVVVYGVYTDAPESSIPFLDEDDRILYDTAKKSGATLITGNKKHFPDEPFIQTPAEFLIKTNTDNVTGLS